MLRAPCWACTHSTLRAPTVPHRDGDRDRDTLTSFHTGFTLFLMTLVLFFTPAGRNTHGSDQFPHQTAGKKKNKIPVPLVHRWGREPPATPAAPRSRSRPCSLHTSLHRWAPGPRFEPQPCHKPCWKTPGKSSWWVVPQFPHEQGREEVPKGCWVGFWAGRCHGGPRHHPPSSQTSVQSQRGPRFPVTRVKCLNIEEGGLAH